MIHSSAVSVLYTSTQILTTRMDPNLHLNSGRFGSTFWDRFRYKHRVDFIRVDFFLLVSSSNVFVDKSMKVIFIFAAYN
jgi:hypothetical protein